MHLPLLSFFLFLHLATSQCVHDAFSHNATKHFLNDFTYRRLLNTGEKGKIRIFVDYSHVNKGGKTQINTIKRLVNITASYFYNVLNVTRLSRLYFPKQANSTCNTLSVPEIYTQKGTIGDLGVICANQDKDSAVYIAKSVSCAFQASDHRPIWGQITWNNPFLRYDQEGFQQVLYVGIHEMTHILGFSAALYSLYPKGNPLFQDVNDKYLTSPKINQQIKKHYGCQNPKGMLLQDQDGTAIASHWEYKVMGPEFMVAMNQKHTYVSRVTLALFQSTGWYDVNYDYGEPSIWGKDKGCAFFNIDDCSDKQFCQGSSFDCDFDGTAIGRCQPYPISGTCKIKKHFTNTVCIDENYQFKNLNAKLNALERGGSSSRCFISDYRQEGQQPTILNNRCYITVCSPTRSFIYLLVGSSVLVCAVPNQKIPAPPGLEGVLTCPANFDNYCMSKKTCPYHCNKNGACINGKCLCTGVTELSTSCLDISIFVAPVETTGGLLNSLSDEEEGLEIGQNGSVKKKKNKRTEVNRKTIKRYSINSECLEGTAFDEIFGECLPCKQFYNCENCDNNGCISCDDGLAPINGQCK